MTADRLLGNAREIASFIDHTLLKPDATESDIAEICRQALECRFASVCVNPCWVPLVHAMLSGSRVSTCCVVGFPLGSNQTRIKVEEAQVATGEGASEIDMVMNVGLLRSNGEVFSEIQAIALAVHASGARLKVILETCLLTEDQKIAACVMAKEGGADFVKTSTGFSTGGATEADVRLMRSIVGRRMGVKASGGVRSLDAMARMIRAGASRIGTSSGVQIIAEFRSGLKSIAADGGSY